MGWKREYLKHKGLFEDLPKKLSMRSSAKWGNCNWTPYIYSNPYRSDKWRALSNKLLKFIKTHVGKSYNDTFAEFKKKFPAYFGTINLAECFRDRFKEYQNRNMNWENWSFYIDNNGLIQNGYVREPKNKEVKINVKNKGVLYSFSENVFKDKRVFNIISCYIPSKYLQYLEPNSKFSQSTYNDIYYHLDRCPNFAVEISSLHTMKWWQTNRYCYDWDTRYIHWNGYGYEYKKKVLSEHSIKQFIFTKHVIEDCDVVKLGSSEFNRHFEDIRKKEASIERANAKVKEAEREALLHDLLQTRKKKEKEENELIRDRHGFDDHSFKNW